MEIRKMKCPYCGSTNNWPWEDRRKVLLPDSDKKDYLLIGHTCNNCSSWFYTKSEIEVTYKTNEDIVLIYHEAKKLKMRKKKDWDFINRRG